MLTQKKPAWARLSTCCGFFSPLLQPPPWISRMAGRGSRAARQGLNDVQEEGYTVRLSVPNVPDDLHGCELLHGLRIWVLILWNCSA